VNDWQVVAVMAAVLASGPFPPADPVASALKMERAAFEAFCARRLADRAAGDPLER
jgi:hypothetical protein